MKKKNVAFEIAKKNNGVAQSGFVSFAEDCMCSWLYHFGRVLDSYMQEVCLSFAFYH